MLTYTEHRCVFCGGRIPYGSHDDFVAQRMRVRTDAGRVFIEARELAHRYCAAGVCGDVGCRKQQGHDGEHGGTAP